MDRFLFQKLMNLLPRAGEGEGGGGAAPSASETSAAPSPGDAPAATTSSDPSPPAAAGDTGSNKPSDTSEEVFDWGDAFGDVIEVPAAEPPPQPAVVQPQQPEPAPKPAEAQPQPPAQPTEAPPAAQAQPPQETQPAPAAPTAESQPPAAETPPDFSTPGKFAQGLRANMAQLAAIAGEKKFALTEEEAEGLETDVPATIPKLMARVHLEAVADVMQQLDQMIPQMVVNQMFALQKNYGYQQKFFSAWPQVQRNNPEHLQVAKRIAQTYRAANPNASVDQMIQEVGQMVVATLKLPATAVAAPAAAASPAPAPKPAPFVPATNGAGGPAPAPAASEWDGLGLNFDE